jgi:glutathione synthase/RimK-type ligase-like ATP-grasp enzyme
MVESVMFDEVPKEVVNTALKAANAVGTGLYGVDLKEKDGSIYVIEVNDNPSLETTEDEFYPEAYSKIVSYIMDDSRQKYPGGKMKFSEVIDPDGVANDRN